MTRERIDQQVDNYFRFGKMAEAIGMRVLYNDNFFTPMALYITAKTLDVISDQGSVGIL